ncbi:hypothetical protein Peur_020885 [Populus x canadensis]
MASMDVHDVGVEGYPSILLQFCNMDYEHTKNLFGYVQTHSVACAYQIPTICLCILRVHTICIKSLLVAYTAMILYRNEISCIQSKLQSDRTQLSQHLCNVLMLRVNICPFHPLVDVIVSDSPVLVSSPEPDCRLHTIRDTTFLESTYDASGTIFAIIFYIS